MSPEAKWDSDFHGHPLMRRSPPRYSVREATRRAGRKCLPSPTWVVSVEAWRAEKSFHQAVATWNPSFTPTPAPSPMLVEVEWGKSPPGSNKHPLPQHGVSGGHLGTARRCAPSTSQGSVGGGLAGSLQFHLYQALMRHAFSPTHPPTLESEKAEW